MYEFEVISDKWEHQMFIYGYSLEDACKRNNLEPPELKVLFYEYID